MTPEPMEVRTDEIERIIDWHTYAINDTLLSEHTSGRRITVDPRFVSERRSQASQRLEGLLNKERLRGAIEWLNKAHRADNAHDFDNETDEYIDKIADDLTQQLEKLTGSDSEQLK